MFHPFHSFFPFQSVFSVYIAILSQSLILSLVMSSLLMSPSKTFFISVTMFLISNIYFSFFLRVSISLLTLLVLHIYPTTEECIFSSSQGIFTKINHILVQKTYLNKFKRTDIIQSTLFDHKGIK